MYVKATMPLNFEKPSHAILSRNMLILEVWMDYKQFIVFSWHAVHTMHTGSGLHLMPVMLCCAGSDDDAAEEKGEADVGVGAAGKASVRVRCFVITHLGFVDRVFYSHFYVHPCCWLMRLMRLLTDQSGHVHREAYTRLHAHTHIHIQGTYTI
jgi:hypothetical protein